VAHSPANPRSITSGDSNWIVKLIVLGLVLLVSITAYVSQTPVTGVELNPYTWETRRFSFFADPFTSYQFTAIQHDNISKCSPAIAGFLSPRKPPSKDRWDLVELGDADAHPSSGPARILFHHLISKSARPMPTDPWEQWTSDHPIEAGILWPALQHLSIHQVYWAVPDLLQMACHLSGNQFSRSVQSHMADQLSKRASELIEAGQLAAAKAAVLDGLSYSAEHAQLNQQLKELPSIESAE
jgi:hypothetical protein